MVEEMVTLQSIAYGDVTGDGGEEAMVVLSMVTGGSAIPHATYIYASEDGKPKLLWAFFTGDRAEGGLRRVYAEKGELVTNETARPIAKVIAAPPSFLEPATSGRTSTLSKEVKKKHYPTPKITARH